MYVCMLMRGKIRKEITGWFWLTLSGEGELVAAWKPVLIWGNDGVAMTTLVQLRKQQQSEEVTWRVK